MVAADILRTAHRAPAAAPVLHRRREEVEERPDTRTHHHQHHGRAHGHTHNHGKGKDR
jgi:hypothetical protein